MFIHRLTINLCELVLSVVLAVFVVYWSYKSFSKIIAGYDVEAELKKNNVAVAILLTALMVATSLIMQETVYPVMGTISVFLTSRGGELTLGQTVLYSAGHLVLGFLVTVGTMFLSLRLFGRLVKDLDDEREIQRGNTAVAIVMAGVIIVIALYLQQGISGLSKSLIPEPSLGSVEVIR